MDSLENLREFVSKGSRTQITTLPPVDLITLDLSDLTKLIDAIEEEHEETARALYKSGVDYGLKQGFADVDLLLDHQQDKLAEHGCYRWQDADSETIRIGDKVITEEFGEVEVEGFIHNAVAFYNYEEQPARLCTIPTKLCHHRAQTVEDVLREFVERWHDTHHDDLPALFAEYAKKLRLAGDGE